MNATAKELSDEALLFAACIELHDEALERIEADAVRDSDHGQRRAVPKRTRGRLR